MKENIDILKNAEVIDEYKETWLDNLDDWLFDHVPGYSYIWRFYHNHLCPTMIKRKIKYFFQRRFRGFDDSETWALDWTFYEWLYPRLKRFQEVNCCYPHNYKSFEKWDNELKKRIEQLHKLLTTDEFDFDELKYIPKKKMVELKEREKKFPGGWKNTYNSMAYYYCSQDFDKWFSKNVHKLWW